MILEPKHKNFKDQYKIKEWVKQILISGANVHTKEFSIILL
jgi:hypothetical protein